jgi:hypothetical protein
MNKTWLYELINSGISFGCLYFNSLISKWSTKKNLTPLSLKQYLNVLHFSIDIILPGALGPGVDSVSKKDDNQGSFWVWKLQPTRDADLTICKPMV